MPSHHLESNRLKDATSPYLLQHANNPVDWHPWGEQAHRLAREQHKPILLSIGYSACHWCHVMAHESFEDAETAALMNQLFINIKVDREERPDLDRIYQTAHQLLAQRPGGWPLTMFLSPEDHTPFFGGTYFPNEARHGLPAFNDLLHKIATAYREHPQDINRQNLSLRQALASLNPAPNGRGGPLHSAPLGVVCQQLEKSYDRDQGGFGQAPKFPHPPSIERLLRHWAATRIAGEADTRARDMAVFTLERMALGGLNDQLGGGFCRYSVDDQWMIPHFEKMLYDNGPLLALYVDAWQATQSPLFQRTAEQTAEWALSEMQSPEGGFYSSFDADSEGEEGKFYVWTPQTVRELLNADEYAVFAPYYGLDREPNFEGQWHLHTYRDLSKLSRELGIRLSQANSLLESAREKLLKARRNRVPPGRDDKILTSWNALMIKGMARAGRVLGTPAYLESAEKALNFLRTSLWHEGRLLATYKDCKAHLAAYLDDHAYLIDAVLELLQARWRPDDLDFCMQLGDLMLEHFQDNESGGFFFTADDHERLIQRPKPLGDESNPAGNGVAAHVLGRLGHLVGNNRYLDAAERTLQMAWTPMEQIPHAHCTLLLALEEYLVPTETLILRGEGMALEKWKQRATKHYSPTRLCIAIPRSEKALPGLLEARRPKENTLAYLCRGTQCNAPMTDYGEFDRELKKSEVRPSAAT